LNVATPLLLPDNLMPYAVAAQPLVESLPFANGTAAWFERLRRLPQSMLLTSGTSSHPAARYDKR